MRFWPLGLLGLGALVWSAAHARRPRPVDVTIGCSPERRAEHILIGNRRIEARPAIDQPALRTAIPDRRAHLRVTIAAETPYRCVGGVIYTLQALGYRRITFTAEPPRSR